VKDREEPRRPSILGRGAAGNPKNRFDRIEVEPDPDELEPEKPRTVFLKDASRSIVARNNSPDVGFDASINPYRGCEHGCSYCTSPDAPILMANGIVKRIEDVRVGDEIYGTERRGWYRRYVKTWVLAHWSVDKPAYRVTLEDGTCLIAGADHRFLTERGWKFVTGAEQGDGRRSHLTTNNKLMGTGAFAPSPLKNRDYKRGYLCGLVRGDGLLASYAYGRDGRAHGNQYEFRLALADEEALRRASCYLLDFEVVTHGFVFQKATAGRRAVQAIRTHARRSVERVEGIVAWPTAPSAEWRKGFLAGIFDAEGSYSCSVLRISNTDAAIIRWITWCLERLRLRFVIERRSTASTHPLDVVRLLGDYRSTYVSFTP